MMDKKKENKKEQNDPKRYKKIEESSQVVGEPMVAYGAMVRHVEDYLEAIPVETMRTLVDLALEDCEKGLCTPHSQMDAWIKERMGWK